MFIFLFQILYTTLTKPTYCLHNNIHYATKGKMNKTTCSNNTTEEEKEWSTIDTVTDTKIAETTDSTTYLHQIDHDKQHHSDEDNNTSDNNCKKGNMYNLHEDTFWNNTATFLTMVPLEKIKYTWSWSDCRLHFCYRQTR